MWGAIRALGAERIGDGVRSIEDPELVEYLAEHRIVLEYVQRATCSWVSVGRWSSIRLRSCTTRASE